MIREIFRTVLLSSKPDNCHLVSSRWTTTRTWSHSGTAKASLW